MNIKSKIAASLAIVTLAASLTIPTSAANAGGKHGWGIAGAVIGTAIVAGAVANSYAEPAYGGYYDGYRRCRFERQYDSYGYYVGTARVCRVY